MAVSTLKQLAAAAIVAQSLGLASAASIPLQARAGREPGLPYAPDTSPYCSWWIDYDGSETCEEIIDFNWIDMRTFYRWNPSVGSDCSGLESGNSYCIEAFDEPPVPEETETTTTTTTTTSDVITTPPPTPTEPPVVITTTTTTSAGNGVETPAPVHLGIVDNCSKFYMVEDGDSCASIAQKNNIRTADVVAWNGLNERCTNLWLDTYACVGLIGGNPVDPPVTTPTTPGNGVETPQPIHLGIVDNCNKFYMVEEGDTCASIAQKNKVRTADVVAWNGLNDRCTNIWLDTYACVGVIGGSPVDPPATTTTPGNGIETPQPVQLGIVDNCNKFYMVEEGDTCASIAQKHSVRTADVVAWNGLNVGCTNIWLDTYACVGIIGGTPTDPPATTTTPGNGIETPQPTQPGIASDCDKFHFVGDGETCAEIAKKNGISVAQFVKWNGLNSACSNLWGSVYTCVRVLGSTPTNPGNGIETPQPVQPGIVGDCDRFHFVGDGELCEKIASNYGISTAQFVKWNGLNSACSNLWSNTYACVRVLGSTPTNPGNGVETPQPTQGSIVANCKKFEFVRSGDTCETVAARRGITVQQMVAWNPSIGKDCTTLWANAYACVGV